MSAPVISRGRTLAPAARGLRAGLLDIREERELAGTVAGVLYLTAALSAWLILLMPGTPQHHWLLVVLLASWGAVWGVICLTVIPWGRAPAWVTHFSSLSGLAIAAIVISATGGADSPARFYLFFVVVFAAYFYPTRTALLYIALCSLVHSLPLLYSDSHFQREMLRELMVVVPTYLVLGAAIAAGKQVLLSLRDQAEEARAEENRLAAEQTALRRVATAVARHADATDIYELVAVETARMIGASASGILRFESDTAAVVEGSYRNAATPGGRYPPGTEVPVRPGSEVDELRRTGRPVRVDDHPPGSPVERLGDRCSVVAPVHVEDRLWGFLAATSRQVGGLPIDAAERLTGFADLLATAIVNTEDRAKLAAQASTDPLTGLWNHRTFHERLREEVSRARRHDRQLTLALVDIDHFKHVNDTDGHGVGDRVLCEAADRLRTVARAEDILARIGGDEFALLLPETDRREAYVAIERARELIAADLLAGHRVTISGGICDLDYAEDADSLFRLADGALYWSKAHGRDVTWLYEPEVVHELSVEERAARMQRSQALMGLRALARAVDAKDPSTQMHSERVAAMATKLADVLEWPSERIGLLREAALIHDVGKLAVPDHLLTKGEELTPDEFEEMKKHAALGAQIASEVLTAEQVSWIRWHHERPDGTGYPDGLSGDEIPEGATLLTLADAWDVMTVSRPYGVPKTHEQAREEIRSLVDRQFTERAAGAMASLSLAAGPRPRT